MSPRVSARFSLGVETELTRDGTTELSRNNKFSVGSEKMTEYPRVATTTG